MSDDELPGLDLDRLRRYLDTTVPGSVGGRLSGEVIEGGRSNLTYIIDDGAQRWVVRRPPLGHVLPTAHDMPREHQVITALRTTKVPVPYTLLLCEDSDVLGAPFYVMEYVEGNAYRSREELTTLGAHRTREIGVSLIDTLVDLHAVEPESVGLSDFVRPVGFIERQLRRWKKQLDGSRSRELPRIDQLHERLVTAMPSSAGSSIVHGDYRLDNVLIGNGDQINAVLDWEMSTLGDPLTDLALLIAYANQGSMDIGVVSNVSLAPGYPGTDDIVERYTTRSGRDVSQLNWYLSFAYFKLAVILEGIFYRFSQGQTVGAGFDKIGSGVEPLIERGISTLREG